MRPESPQLKCPVCNARFRGAEKCSRCGGELGPLMILAARAWRHRKMAIRALLQGDAHGAIAHAEQAQSLHGTTRSEQIALLARLWALLEGEQI